jgi:hypothetical protein
MKAFIVGAFGATLLAFQPGIAAAQCMGGGIAVAGYYRGDGSYVPGGCATTNPFTPGQVLPSGAASAPSTSSATVVPTSGAPGVPVAPGENAAGVGRAQARGAPATRLLPAGDSTGVYGTSLAAAPASPVAGAAVLLVAGDSTGAYGTSLPAATMAPEHVNALPTAGSE